MSGPYTAQCASDRDPDWPLWMVMKNCLNVLTSGLFYGGKFGTREHCEAEAERLNHEASQ